MWRARCTYWWWGVWWEEFGMCVVARAGADDSRRRVVVCGDGVGRIGVVRERVRGTVDARDGAGGGCSAHVLLAVGVGAADLAVGRGAKRASGAGCADLAVILVVVVRCERAASIDVCAASTLRALACAWRASVRVRRAHGGGR